MTSQLKFIMWHFCLGKHIVFSHQIFFLDKWVGESLYKTFIGKYGLFKAKRRKKTCYFALKAYIEWYKSYVIDVWNILNLTTSRHSKARNTRELGVTAMTVPRPTLNQNENKNAVMCGKKLFLSQLAAIIVTSKLKSLLSDLYFNFDAHMKEFQRKVLHSRDPLADLFLSMQFQ